MRYAKAIAAVLGAGLTAAAQALPLTPTQQGWVTVGIAVCTSAAVYLVPNSPGGDGSRTERPSR